MLKYVAALATAITVMISSSPVQAAEQLMPATERAEPISHIRVVSSTVVIQVAKSADAAYHLSKDEQKVMHRALLRSVKILS